VVKGIEDYEAMVKRGELEIKPTSMADDSIATLVNLMEKEEGQTAIERSIGVLLAYHESIRQAESAEDEVVTVVEGKLNIFTQVEMPDTLKALMEEADVERFARPMLLRSTTRSKIAYLERLGGASESHSQIVTRELIKDMQTVTEYPPDASVEATGEVLAKIALELCEHVNIRKRQKRESGDDDKKKK